MSTIALAAMAVLFLVPASLATEYRPRELKLGHIAATNHPVHQWALKFKETLESTTGGAMTVSIYPGAQLGTGQEMVEGLRFGALDVGMLDVSFYSYVPQAQILEYPFLYRDHAHFWQTLDDGIGHRIRTLARQSGYELIGWAEFGRRHMTNNVKPIRRPEDVRGLRMRVPPGTIYVRMMQAMGAKVTPVDFTELYLALQLGTVDGQENPLSTIQSIKLFEVQKYLSLTGHMYTLLYPAMNAKAFAGLNRDEQAAIQRAGDVATQYVRTYVDNQEAQLLQQLQDEGMRVNQIDVASFAPVTDAVARTLQDKVPLEWVDEVRKRQ